MSLYTALIRPLLFRLDAETAHRFAVEFSRVAGSLPLVPQITNAFLEFTAPQLETEVSGIRFNNPIGLAAGWDKSGRAMKLLDNSGFGFYEIGSISGRSSLGNRKPRLFRLPNDLAIIVNYGLPNEGVDVIAARLASHHARIPIGVNIVKTNDGADAPLCTDDEIIGDYLNCVSRVHRYSHYISLNLSCPNARAGKDFFAIPGNIRLLLEQIAPLQVGCPFFLKVAPDPGPESMERLIVESESFSFVKGFMFNLPTGKPGSLRLVTPREILNRMPGAVSGKPVAHLINQCIREMYVRMPRNRFSIIAAGGVFTAEDAYEKICLGASLVQLYTALVYEGPGIVKTINRGLLRLLQRDGFENIRQAVGTSAGN
jgi:dihydroorotate dehydrogenase